MRVRRQFLALSGAAMLTAALSFSIKAQDGGPRLPPPRPEPPAVTDDVAPPRPDLESQPILPRSRRADPPSIPVPPEPLPPAVGAAEEPVRPRRPVGEIVGRPVRTQDGELLGHIEDLVLDDAGRVHHFILDDGQSIQARRDGDGFVAIPWTITAARPPHPTETYVEPPGPRAEVLRPRPLADPPVLYLYRRHQPHWNHETHGFDAPRYSYAAPLPRVPVWHGDDGDRREWDEDDDDDDGFRRHRHLPFGPDPPPHERDDEDEDDDD